MECKLLSPLKYCLLIAPLIEPEWNVNFGDLESGIMPNWPLIEPEWNVNEIKDLREIKNSVTFNRTRMECKLENQIGELMLPFPFNRTRMECKFL